MKYIDRQWEKREASIEEVHLLKAKSCDDYFCCFSDSPAAGRERLSFEKPFFFWDIEQVFAGIDKVVGGDLLKHCETDKLIMVLYTDPINGKFTILEEV